MTTPMRIADFLIRFGVLAFATWMLWRTIRQARESRRYMKYLDDWQRALRAGKIKPPALPLNPQDWRAVGCPELES